MWFSLFYEEWKGQELVPEMYLSLYIHHKLYHAASEIMGHQKLSGEVDIEA